MQQLHKMKKKITYKVNQHFQIKYISEIVTETVSRETKAYQARRQQKIVTLYDNEKVAKETKYNKRKEKIDITLYI